MKTTSRAASVARGVFSHYTEITQAIGDEEPVRMYWGDFVAANDPDVVEEVEDALFADGKSVTGGGAAPVFEVRLGWPDDRDDDREPDNFEDWRNEEGL